MLGKAKVAGRLPAKDLDRAGVLFRKLGLDPVEQREGGLRYWRSSWKSALIA
ncbi:hypothetical protein [Bradyrhizobium zhanjiangense]|uniref:hypothetical protein n=1 Tax=Bradyrhizobium zhanjiangense TaxID=1325107 RepID=UPI0013E8AEA5|nr:hypothetical protein [Bradyrhizobium zhanjiangense]